MSDSAHIPAPASPQTLDPRPKTLLRDLAALHSGGPRDPGEPLARPITQSTAFAQGTVGAATDHQYSRVSNPTVAILEQALGDLESAPPGVCFSSGMGAETALFLTLLKAGDHVLCARSVYGGTTRLLQQVLSGLGIESTFVDATDLRAVAGAVRSTTRLLFAETPANPTLEVTDLRAVARIAHDNGAILAVDNTFLSPVLQQPLDLGADVSVYATTKFIEGHSVAMGGSLISRDEALLERLRFIRKCTGGIQTPYNAWLTLNGLRTLPLRMRAQSQSALAIAAWLIEQDGIAIVHHPSLLHGPAREIAEAQHLGHLHGAVVTFEVAGGIEAGKRFAGACRLCTLVEHVGSVETLLTHPASMTHADVPPAQREAAGVTGGLLRLSVGLEPVEAIMADLSVALEAARSARARSGEGAAPCQPALR